MYEEIKEAGEKFKPAYLVIAEAIAKDIEEGVYKAGDRIPSLKDLSIRYRVHKNSVSPAFRILKDAKLLEIKNGVGMVVAKKSEPDTVAVIVPQGYYKLATLAEMKGHQELYTKQSPQRLKRMREFSMIESAVSSNRIEGISIEAKRVGTVLFGNTNPRDRNEEEVRGYRNALELIHARANKLKISQETICQLHALSRPGLWDSGKFKEKAGDIIETYPDGASRIRFKTVAPEKVTEYLNVAIEKYEEIVRDNRVFPLIALAAFNLDFLCIHPFRDGNGRVSRLILLLMLYQLGYEAGRYISIEKMIEATKEQYYETLELSSLDWHTGKHDAWPYINYLLFTFKNVYKEFESRFTDSTTPRGEKTGQIIRTLNEFTGEFTLKELEQNCPGISRDMIQTVMKQNAEYLTCSGHGAGSKWRRIGVIPLNKGNNSGNGQNSNADSL